MSQSIISHSLCNQYIAYWIQSTAWLWVIKSEMTQKDVKCLDTVLEVATRYSYPQDSYMIQLQCNDTGSLSKEVRILCQVFLIVSSGQMMAMYFWAPCGWIEPCDWFRQVNCEKWVTCVFLDWVLFTHQCKIF